MHITFFGSSGTIQQSQLWVTAVNETGHTAGVVSLDVSGGEPEAAYDWDDICGWDDSRQPDEHDEHRRRARGVAGYVEHCLRESRPDVAVVWGNATVAQRAAAAVCRIADVPVVYSELGWFRRPPDGSIRTNVFDTVGFKEGATELTQEWWDRRLTQQENEHLDNYIAWWKGAKSSKHGQRDQPLPEEVGNAGKPVLLVLLQLDQDSSCHYAEGITTQQAVMDAVRFGAGDSWQVVVKEHPAGLPRCDRSTNEVWLRDQNLHDCLEVAGCVVTANSNAGLESLIYEVPVVCLASAPYSGLGFTHDIREPRVLELVLRRLREDGPRPPHLGNVFLRAFLHYVIYEYCFAHSEVGALTTKLERRIAGHGT